ncbi:DUF4190 domain-containing protein [Xylanimonas allomyrinae]|uniref:DUF4190 domain-containing protein n=1 Tax=Xylanimonas allomyrinae TaxID=2509459 RepID=UPI001FE52C96|nr:DUF4190 domain-containing protein [Xylanimonas allomyrinae]
MPLVLGLVGLRRTRRLNLTGRGFAIAGIALGAVTTVVCSALVFYLVMILRSDAFQELVHIGFAETELTQAPQMSLGECFDVSGDDLAPGPTVDCAHAHDAEVVGVQDVLFESYPGASALDADTRDFCLETFPEYVGVEYEDSSLDMSYLFPSMTSWAQGDRQLVCYVVAGIGEPLVDSVQGSGR